MRSRRMEPIINDVDNVAASLVREYLHSKSYEKTLRTLDEELSERPLPQAAKALNSRSLLGKTLRIEKLLKKNKQDGRRIHSTILEVIVSYLLGRTRRSCTSSMPAPAMIDTIAGASPMMDASSTTKSDDVESIRTINGRLQENDATFTSTVHELGSDDLDARKLTSPSELTSAWTTTTNKTIMQSGNPAESTSDKSAAPATSASAATSTSISSPTFCLSAKGGRRISLGGLEEKERSACKSKTSSIRRSTTAASLPDESFVASEMTAATIATNRRQEITPMGNWLTSNTCPRNSTSSPAADQGPTSGPQPSSNSKLGDIEIGDLDAVDESTSGLMVSLDSSHVWLTLPPGTPLDVNTAAELKVLLFGNYKKRFPKEWMMQTFMLNCRDPDLTYGLIQKKAGPCGVLACVQAYLLKELLFSKGSRRTTSVDGDQVVRCLALAFANILWKTGGQKAATIAFPSSRSCFADERPGLCDGFIEKINLMKFTDLAALQSFLSRHVGWYCGESSGRGACVAFLYSVLLSRGIQNVKEDMDDVSNCLIGAHGYCTQEVINLLLTGHTTSNVFDNEVVLDEGTESQSTLKGVTRRSDIGLLALFEHYNSCEVGQHFKCPRYPIWVVCSESHYSVLFAKEFASSMDQGLSNSSTQSCKEPSKFDLYYYDGLLQQDHEIRLTIDLTNERKPTKYYKDVEPPLESCIRTKWKRAAIDWNGTEPLL